MPNTPFKYELGMLLLDTITRFTGTVLSRSQWLYGCNTYGLKSSELKDGKPMDLIWFDEDQLEQIPIEEMPRAGRPSGGPVTPVPRTNR